MRTIDENSRLIPEPMILYRRRWLMLIIWLLNYIQMVGIWFAFAPIEVQVANYYNITNSKVNSLSQVFMFIEIPLLIMALWIYGYYGLRFGITTTSIVACVGTWLRYFGSDKTRFSWLMAGQIVSAFGQAFMDASSTKLAAQWFGERERGLAVGIIICGITAATSSIMFLIPKFVTDANFPYFMLLEAGYSSFVLVITVLFFRSKPPTPPSASALQKPQADFSYSITRIWFNLPFILLFFGFGFVMGTYELLITILNFLLWNNGYSKEDCGLILALLVVSGTIGSIVVGIVLDSTKRYKLALIILLTINVILVGALKFALRPHMLGLLGTGFVIIGFCLVSSYPAFLEACAEVTFPIPEEYSAALTTICGNGIGAIMTSVTGLSHFQKHPSDIVYLFVGMSLCSLILIAFVKPYYKRHQFEQSGFRVINQRTSVG